MTVDEAMALATRALRRGSCSAHKLATEGCATCEASESAIRVLRTLPVLVSCADCRAFSRRVGTGAHLCSLAERALPAEDVIPEWCPMRGAQ